MRVFPDQNQKVVVPRGYLTGISALSVILAGMLAAESDYLPVWVGIAFIAIGGGLQVRSLPYLMIPPQPLDQDRREAQG